MDGQDPESINPWLRFFANVFFCAWNNILGPIEYLVQCMLRDLPSFKLPVPHLGQDNMIRNNNLPYLWNSNYLGQWSRSMAHKNSVSCMGGAVWAIRVVNEKQLLLILVGMNIMFSFWNEYVKLAWEFTGKPGQENWNLWHLKKFENDSKDKKSCTYWSPLYLVKSMLKSKGKSIRIFVIQKHLTWLKLQ